MTEHYQTTPPAAEELPAGWRRATTPPAWVLEQNQGSAGWRNVGSRRWRADLDSVFASHLLLLVNADATGFMRYAIDLDYGDPANDDIIDQVFGDLQGRLDYEALPECVAPGCTEKGEARFYAAELGHLAGKVYAKGDEIRMCWPHGNDALTAGVGLDSIAEWLRPDAEVLDPEYRMAGRYDGFTDDYIHRTRARVPRLLIPGGTTP